MNDKVEIKFSDTGIGMDEETKSKIFIPFFTTKVSNSKENIEAKGTGLGLSVSFAIIQNHNGIMTVESENGRGSTFTIQLPAVTAATEIKNHSEQKIFFDQVNISREAKILIVDDEVHIADVVVKALKNSGYKNAIAVNSGSKAISIFKEINFDFVFLDMKMPDMKGEDVFDEIKKINANTKIVYISGNIGLSGDELIKKGAHAFITKPFELDKVIEILNGNV